MDWDWDAGPEQPGEPAPFWYPWPSEEAWQQACADADDALRCADRQPPEGCA